MRRALLSVPPRSPTAAVSRRCVKKHGVRVSLDSDSHCAAQVGRTPRGLRLLEELDFPPELIINSSPERLAAFFRERGIEL